MEKLIIVLILLLGIVAIAQLMRVLELSGQLRNKKEEDIPAGDNKLNASLLMVFMLAFYAFFIWLMSKYGDGGLGISASEHGRDTDQLLKINFYIIIAVFFLTNTLLFYFAYKYQYKKGRKALYYPHNNKLELLWTVVPASVLAVIIILGLRTWNNIQANPSDEAVRVELYSKQFEWVVRYSGEDNKLGYSNFRLVDPADNPIGLQTNYTIDSTIARMSRDIHTMEIKKMKADSATSPSDVLSDDDYDFLKNKIDRMKRHLHKVVEMKKTQTAEIDQYANDDKVIKVKELHLIVNKEYEFNFRSQDVIHSAYFPHFRAQINTVPGTTTRLKFKPIVTTDSMRTVRSNPAFDYILLCNKICGASHSNMWIKIVVEKQEDFDKWIAEQKTFFAERMPAAEEPVKEEKLETEMTADTAKIAEAEVPSNE